MVSFAGCTNPFAKQSPNSNDDNTFKTSTISNTNTAKVTTILPEDTKDAKDTTEASTETDTTTQDSTGSIAFFYQTVGLFMNGAGENTVRVGTTTDGGTVESYDATVLDWTQGANHTYSYGDPVYSRLPGGTWAMTARSSNQDPRGSNYLLYHESSCPLVDDSAVVAIGPSTAAGCKSMKAATMGKTSQVFTDDTGKNYIFHMAEGSIYLTYLSDETHSATSLDSICMLEQPVADLSTMNHGDSTLVLARGTGDNMLLSDTAIARRADGTWVLFVKGIPEDLNCTDRTLCELCGRSIYRTTSTDLVHWSDLEEVVEAASVPEAITAPDGTVWLYWQDFSNTCDANDEKLSAQARISGAYEQSGSNDLSNKQTVSFPDEEFQSNSVMHYATNGNPVTLPNAQAQADLEACLN